MGTRNLTIVKLGGKVKVAQYCQWDGYPTGQGETISEFIREKLDLRKFKAKVKALQFATDEEVESLWKSCGAKGEFVTMDISETFEKKYPQFHRNTGADVLQLIQDGKVDKLTNSIDFLKDGLFCEYAYEIDLDAKKVKVYTGGTKPSKIYTFSAFAKKGAMQKLEQELQGEE